ncbi:MAG TPA: DUF3800 domain-containing protein [Methanothermococcus okinawensis]|uniref:DUF3800 domain-containing protein n=1 Tax=Methanothermococcus okinawensis TaxID=155863 RepID=A0A832ZJ59_9EURY|nr:DUF3800 domain-containing protein [Methanothermococcus okinawensis]
MFSDESGNYKQNPKEKFLNSNPYYIRSAFIIEALEWKVLRKNFIDLKIKYGINPYDEIKWSDIWRDYKRRGKDKKLQDKIEFIKNSLNLLKDLNYCRIIFTKEIEVKKMAYSEYNAESSNGSTRTR